ncbi:TonB-dependent receptor [Patiriisocius marinistellae]|uniref:TonB-dependent receptor n=1 Tax=Patiriisocius marinistellae TaxID=2494560 RepID=A0A5J4FUT4_9FLAO|nr:outer membrane beta-barrel family protein [Patiriisocius marinistellae]GEQ84938.1 TonB-dependent receptor [Patiriisocius marinistellae]
MNKLIFFFFFTAFSYAQEFSINGNITDEANNAISFATISILENNAEDSEDLETVLVANTITDDSGNFIIEGLFPKRYTVQISFLGYTTTSQIIELSANEDLGSIRLKESIETLDETVVVAKRPTIKKEPGKLIFNVENTSIATGSTLDILQKTPGVLVSETGISVKGKTPVIYINGKRVYLSTSEINSLLQSTDASAIKAVEVITSPGAKYDAEAGIVVDIKTSRAVSIGYKGAVNGTYEQGVFAKYRLGTSHFYKNNWLNLFGSYTFSPRKEFKEDVNNIRFFNSPSAITTHSTRQSDFNRTTRSQAHQANIVADAKVNDKHDVGINIGLFISPDIEYQNNAISKDFNTLRQLDSIYTTASNSNHDTSNLSFNLNHTWKLSEAGANVMMNANYILYDIDKLQHVETNFFLADGSFIKDNNFYTDATQSSDIATLQLDFNIPVLSGTIETGVKYSNINTDSSLDFFDTNGDASQINPLLSDGFLYEESIYAAYFSFAKDWDKWALNIGLRGEQTDVTGISRKLGDVNTQNYFELFPSLSIEHSPDKDATYGISYARSISRPRYESLNPFRYFINENNFSDGNPNLVPAIDSKYTMSYTYKNTWFFEAYYWETKNPLGELIFQNNQTRVLQNQDVNLIKDFQYSFDIVYAKPILSWWYLQLVTSSFYLENEFFAEQSSQETYSNDTFGFYGEMYSGLTISEVAGITSDITAFYISNFIYGSYDYKNQFSLSASLRKSLWSKRASITVGVDDIFKTKNVPLSSRYYNQDNSYFAQDESRLFRVGFKYNFGNARLRDNDKRKTTNEGDRLN